MRGTGNTSFLLKTVCLIGATIWAIPLAWFFWNQPSKKETKD